ncbi:MAG: cupredoxin domain-containing protein [Candidatus Paceibacterota bacterium]
MNKNTILSIVISIALIIFALVITNDKGGERLQEEKGIPANNVSIIENKQIIEIQAKGGYQPRKSIAKAGIPTILRMNTSGTFDCSSSVRIPSMNIFKNLPQSGVTDIELGIQPIGILDGTCGMGMYPFEIEFQ